MSKKDINTEKLAQEIKEEYKKEEDSVVSENFNSYLSIVFNSYFERSGRIQNAIDIYESLTERIEKNINKDIYIEQVDDVAWEVFNELIHYVSVEAMKLAISIENGKYQPYT